MVAACWECPHAARFRKGDSLLGGLAVATDSFAVCTLDGTRYNVLEVVFDGDGTVADPEIPYSCDFLDGE